jgi:hypothetical protein
MIEEVEKNVFIRAISRALGAAAAADSYSKS